MDFEMANSRLADSVVADAPPVGEIVAAADNPKN
jgi:hypothetical protein